MRLAYANTKILKRGQKEKLKNQHGCDKGELKTSFIFLPNLGNLICNLIRFRIQKTINTKGENK